MFDGIIIFFWLVVAHYVCDFALQSEFMAHGKANKSTGAYPRWHIMVAHCMIHAGGVALVLSGLGFPMLFAIAFGLIELIAHMSTDKYKNSGYSSESLNQFAHLLFKFFYAAISVQFIPYLEMRAG